MGRALCGAAGARGSPLCADATSPCPGPQFETAAEARWLASYGDAVGMSTASEVRTAREHGLETAVLALVVNRSGASAGHEEVLAAARGMATRLREALPAIL